VGTLFMYGQTGSGKTHTMTGIEEGVCRQLSLLLHRNQEDQQGGGDKASSPHPLTVPGVCEVRKKQRNNEVGS
jgi:hypothetical protein